MRILDSIEELQKSGIYSITNIITEQRYIGQAKKFLTRAKSHINALRRGDHDNAYLQNSFNKYSSSAFEFKILEVAHLENLTEQEQYWMNHFNVLDRRRGFNMGTAASNPMLGNTHTPEARKKMSKVAKSRSCSEETRKKLSEGNKGKAKKDRQAKIESQFKGTPSHSLRNSKIYNLTSPSSETFIVKNLASFCRVNGLSVSHMRAMIAKDNYFYKGWKGYKQQSSKDIEA